MINGFFNISRQFIRKVTIMDKKPQHLMNSYPYFLSPGAKPTHMVSYPILSYLYVPSPGAQPTPSGSLADTNTRPTRISTNFTFDSWSTARRFTASPCTRLICCGLAGLHPAYSLNSMQNVICVGSIHIDNNFWCCLRQIGGNVVYF